MQWDDGRLELVEGDCRGMLAGLAADSVDACVTDPPYELDFMGRAWDGTGIAFDVGFWRDVLRVLKPGAHALVFTAARSYHRVACAMEDAGFEIRDQIDWVYASGMPHGKNVGDGWHTLLKPAHEPIVVARKPGGTGGLHVDACRIPVKAGERTTDGGDWRAGRKATGIYGEYRYSTSARPSSKGRFPSDMLFDGVMAGELDRRSDGVSRMFPVFHYEPKAPQSERPTADRVRHLTVKPLALMRWLVRLACPVDGLVVEPFAGSGTTLEACRLEGVRCRAAELDSAYARLIAARLAAPAQPGLF